MKQRRFALCLSFANLVYARAWSDLIVSPQDQFFRKTLQPLTLYAAVATNVLVLAVLVHLFIANRERMPAWLTFLGSGFACLLLALGMRSVGAGLTSFLRSGLFRILPPSWLPYFAVLVCACVLGAMKVFPSLLARAAKGFLAAAVPCVGITFLGCLAAAVRTQPLRADPPLAAHLAGSPANRVLWVVFDEWDERLTFPNRARGTQLPALDRLAADSLKATNAMAALEGMPIVNMATADAIPSLLYGRRLIRSEIGGQATERIDFDGEPATLLGTGDSVFSEARARQWNTAATGWYLPYCRVFAAQLTDCYWDEKYSQASSAAGTVGITALEQTRMLFETNMFSLFGQSLVTEHHAEEYKSILSAASRYAADPSMGLIFVHFNVPHTPYFRGVHTGRNDGHGFSADLYDAALELVDDSVATLLSAIRKAGLEADTAIILSSDHPARFPTRIDGGQDPRVPFLVHLPNQKTGMILTQRFSAIRSAKLAIGIASGALRTQEDVAGCLTSPKETSCTR